MKIFIDANILMYAAGAPSPYKGPSTALLEQVVDGVVDAVTDAEVLQEILYRYWHLQLLDKGSALVEQATRMIPDVLPVDRRDVLLAKDLLAHRHRGLEPRDAIHAAVMLNHGLIDIYSYDTHFDSIPGLKRRRP